MIHSKIIVLDENLLVVGTSTAGLDKVWSAVHTYVSAGGLQRVMRAEARVCGDWLKLLFDSQAIQQVKSLGTRTA
ncbi:hypothetical protein [Pseudomonas syringae group genomosp. 7]|uniref:hypothetical protein n=1 Tax=Pseudomonas syringae group genomosp. 7 TaxID=251699 RepID=UPI0011C4604E|nr:hypothetical protein [Pseudomonas syringae group genomosp. 7]